MIMADKAARTWRVSNRVTTMPRTESFAHQPLGKRACFEPNPLDPSEVIPQADRDGIRLRRHHRLLGDGAIERHDADGGRLQGNVQGGKERLVQHWLRSFGRVSGRVSADSPPMTASPRTLS